LFFNQDIREFIINISNIFKKAGYTID